MCVWWVRVQEPPQGQSSCPGAITSYLEGCQGLASKKAQGPPSPPIPKGDTAAAILCVYFGVTDRKHNP